LKQNLIFIIPIILFSLLSIFLGIGLFLKPKEIPSALIGKTIPLFNLPPVSEKLNGLKDKDLRLGKPVLVNVFASWCGPCRIEHPLFMELSRNPEIIIYAINHKDNPSNAIRWLDLYGNPYKKIGSDLDGRVSIDFGVYGVPETFVIDGKGCVQYKHISVLTKEILDREIVPRLKGKKHVKCKLKQ